MITLIAMIAITAILYSLWVSYKDARTAETTPDSIRIIETDHGWCWRILDGDTLIIDGFYRTRQQALNAALFEQGRIEANR